MASNVNVIMLMADYGHDPTEAAVPYSVFKDAGFNISFATETGKAPECDRIMLTGWTQKLLGAAQPAIDAYNTMSQSSEWQKPLSWSGSGFTLMGFDLVFLPGGHDKGVRQILDSEPVKKQLAEYFPHTKRPAGTKACAAICHGVQVLAHADVLNDVATTALPGVFENSAYQSTRLFLGDYYKTYGAGTENVEDIVKAKLRDAGKQWKSSANPATPFVVEDEAYYYMSGRWPGDAQLLAEKTVEMVKRVKNS